MRRLIPSLLILSLLLAPLLSACGGERRPPPSAEAVLSAMQETMTRTAQPTPEGLVYSRISPPDAPTYLTETLLTALYGRAAEGLLAGNGEGGEPAAVGDAALFLSVAPYPCELAVFRCSDTDVVPTVVSLCRGRLDTVARGYAESPLKGETTGLVAVEDCFVLLIIAEDPQAVAEGVGAALERMR